jgi:hypothetical protein
MWLRELAKRVLRGLLAPLIREIAREEIGQHSRREAAAIARTIREIPEKPLPRERPC